jgi:hypothetical protein
MLGWQTMCFDQCMEEPGWQWRGQGPGGAVEARRPSEGHGNRQKNPCRPGSTWLLAVAQCRVSILKSVGLYRPRRQQGLNKEL